MVASPTPYTPCIVDRPMNDHGAVTLSEITGNRTFQVVEYAAGEVQETLAMAAKGTTVRVWLEALTSRGDAWLAVAIESGVETDPRNTELLEGLVPL